MVTAQDENKQNEKPRKPYVRSPYLFPAYDFGVARRIAGIVERDGAGSLTEETLAIALRSSAKSSGFRLRTLAARQFKLLIRQGQNLSTTDLAKAVIKPTSEQEQRNAIIESFLAVPLFKAVATRFKGQPLPQGEAFRNILEREFKIESNRVNDAERVLMDSAREAGLLQTSGNNVYLVTQTVPVSQPSLPISTPTTTPTVYPPQREIPTTPTGGFLTISEQDLAKFDDDEFAQIWQALGKVIRARSKRQQAKEESITEEETTEPQNEASEEGNE